MGNEFSHLPEEVARSLRAYARRRRLYELADILLSAFLAWGVLALVAMHLDRFLFLETATRTGLSLGAHAVAGVLLLVLLVRFLLHRPGARQIAYELEARLPPGVDERFVTLEAVAARAPEAADELGETLLEELRRQTVAHARGLDAGSLVRASRTKRSAFFAALLLLLGIGLNAFSVYQFPLMLQRFLHPGANLPKPSFVQLEVTPAKIVVGRGGEAVLQVEVKQDLPAAIRRLLEMLDLDPGRCAVALAEQEAPDTPFAPTETIAASRVQRRLFLFSRTGLQRSFAYRVRCGDARTAVRFVEVVAQPRVTDLTLRAVPPDYSGLPETTVRNPGAVARFLAGSRVSLTFRVDQPVSAHELLLGKEKTPVRPQWAPQTRTGAHELTLDATVDIEIRVVNDRGFANAERARLTLIAEEDQKPVVRLESPAEDLERVPGEYVNLKAALEDDLGVTEAAVLYRLNPSLQEDAPTRESTVELPASNEPEGADTGTEQTRRHVDLAAVFDLDDTGAVPGDEVELSLRARDAAGNDGVSRTVRVRVVAFTRGENERRRILALRMLRAACADVAADAPPEADPLALSAESYDGILQRMREAGIPLSERPSVASLLDLLEREQHLTDAPRHKRDLRLLHGALLEAARPAPADGNGDSRAARLGILAETTLPGLIRYRQAQNLAWRLFGLQAEAERIAGELDVLIAMEEAPRDRQQTLRRRAKLYLETLQNLGEELIALARVSETLDEEVVKERQGSLVTGAYYLKRKSLTKARESCREVRTHLRAMFGLLLPALPPLFARQEAARAALTAAGERRLAAIEEAGASARPWARELLAAQARMLELDPFGAVAARLRLLRLGALAAGEEFPAGPSAEVVAAEKDALARLALLWERRRLARDPRVTDDERVLAEGLLRLEGAALRGQAPVETVIESMKALVADRTAPGHDPFAPEETSLHAAEQTLRRTLGEATIEATRPAALLAELNTRLAHSAEMVQALGRDLRTGENPAGLKTRLAQTSSRLRADGEAVARAHSLMAVHLSDLAGAGDEVGPQEVLFVKIRAAWARHRTRTETLLHTLQQARGTPLDAGNIGRLTVACDQLGTQLGTLAAVFSGVAEEFDKGGLAAPEARARYPVLAEFDATRRRLRTCQALYQASAPAAVVEAYLKNHPELLQRIVAERADLATNVSQALEHAGTLLRGETFERRRYEEQLAHARAHLAAYRTLIAGFGDAVDADTLLAPAQAVAEALKPLALPKNVTPAALNKRILALDEALRRADSFVRLFAQLARDEADDTGFRGGPTGIWDAAARPEAARARRRLLDQLAYARREALAGLLAVKRANTPVPALDDAYAWSLILQRVVRSDLSGPVRMRTTGGGDGKGDPLRRWLLQESSEALKEQDLRHYPKITREYLESVRDFLRY